MSYWRTRPAQDPGVIDEGPAHNQKHGRALRLLGPEKSSPTAIPQVFVVTK